MTIFWIAYWIIGLIVGYFLAKDVYTPDGPRPSHQIQARVISWALVIWIIGALAWPVVLAVVGIGVARMPPSWVGSGRRFADWIFRVKKKG